MTGACERCGQPLPPLSFTASPRLEAEDEALRRGIAKLLDDLAAEVRRRLAAVEPVESILWWPVEYDRNIITLRAKVLP